MLNTLDSGPGSLRQAILDANTNVGPDTISFQIPGAGVHTITPAAALPPVLDVTVVDGMTQPGYAGMPLIELNGASAGNNAGLRVLSGNNLIQGLVINRFGGSGIQVEGTGTNIIRGCFLGTDSSGTIARPNVLEGIWILNSSGNIVGGGSASDRNVISGNSDAGVYVQNGSGNIIQGNLIGTSASGSSALGNGNNGITLYNAPGNQVGGAVTTARNIISANRGSGIYLNGTAATGNVIQGNYIGTGAGGSSALSNAFDGITVNGSGANLVGGTNSGEGNLMAGNGKAGISLSGSGALGNLVQGNLLGTEASGKLPLGNGYAGVTLSSARSNWIGGIVPAARNVISGNLQDGVFLSTNSTGNFVAANFIGVDITGTNAIANRLSGISIYSARSNVVGGEVAAARNIISGNSQNGILIAYDSSGNTVAGNFIGPDTTGNRALSNGRSGMQIEAPANLVGGATAGSGNVISGNGLDGVMLAGMPASNNLLQGNFIGVVANGNKGLPNGRAGVGISSAPANIIGGAIAGAANILSANVDAGVYLIGSGATGNQILGNLIGTDITGTLALGNVYEGVYIQDASSNFIGNDTPGSGNLIAANHTRGIYLTNASWNVIQRNLIGTQIDGLSPLGNTFHNIECEWGANNNSIGGSQGSGNRIAFAQTVYAGVRIRDNSLNNRILGNAIFGNGALGIDLGPAGITANDPCDSDTGANQFQNWPNLTQAVSGASTGIRVTLNSAASGLYLLQFFANPVCDISGAGEGEIYLGNFSLPLSAACTGTFVASFPVKVPVGYVITATATDSANNTSEFSACVPVAPVPALQMSLAPDRQLLLSWTNSPPGFVLKQTTELVPPVAWSKVPIAPGLTNSMFSVKLPLSDVGNMFYMLTFE